MFPQPSGSFATAPMHFTDPIIEISNLDYDSGCVPFSIPTASSGLCSLLPGPHQGHPPNQEGAMAQTGPALGPGTLHWEEMCRRAGGGRESMPPQHPPVCPRGPVPLGFPMATLTDAGSDGVLGPLAREMRSAGGSPRNTFCRSLHGH